MFRIVCLLLFSITLNLNAQENCFPDCKGNIILNTSGNKLWEGFAEKLKTLKSQKKGQIVIAHLGDSHIQGGYFSNRFRELVSENFGEAGRGFVFPYSLANTNGPEDVKFTSSSGWNGEKYNHAGSKTGIEGYNLFCKDTDASFSFWLTQGSEALYPFNELIVYHNGPGSSISCNSADTFNEFIGNDILASHFSFTGMKNNQTLVFRNTTKLQGMELRNNHAGIRYHSIGVNGLTYSGYLKSIDYLSMLKSLHPDCIFISLGTNDAYVKRLNLPGFRKEVEAMIASVQKELPGCCILLTTPGDHLFNGRNNKNLLKVRSVIIEEALAKRCPYWDFFSVMGGLGSCRHWAKFGGMYRDNIHLSKLGYKWQAEMFYEAFCNAVEPDK